MCSMPTMKFKALFAGGFAAVVGAVGVAVFVLGADFVSFWFTAIGSPQLGPW